jgi:maltose alpha-D-glucosyltransferase/alpha-amylase
VVDDDLLWYKDAIIYEAHVKSFADSNDDGIGDFRGLTEKLGYLQDLGITCLWLLPFFPSPLKDDGYDIADYRDVHPRYGTLDDFERLVEAAHTRGIRVLIELVVNHTSDQHPWFQAARRAPAGSRERDFYVWSDTDQKFPETRIIFTDTEKSNWTFDPVAGQYYWHRFFSHQPDLNHNNPEVVDAVIDVMRFWLDRGVDALRLDAVPYLCVREGTNNENLPETHGVLRRIRRELDAQYPGRMLLAEANQWPADVRPYFGDADECHMAFHFPLMPRMFMALRQEDRHPITEILRQTPELPPSCQWALFLRNHDELTLEMVTDEERDYMYSAYAADPLMRLNVGIRRRLSPLMENSRRRVELLNVLLFTLPGTPVIYYGDEIGMGDNVYLGDRNGVRTPMQWTSDRNAGFSKADPARLYAPLIMDPVYGYQAINVEAQERYPFSLLNWMKRLIALRKRHTVLGRGGLEFLPCSNRKVLAFVRQDERESLLVVCNLSRYPQPAPIDLSAYSGQLPIEMLGETEFPRIEGRDYFLTLGPYGYYVFRLDKVLEPVTARSVVPQPEKAALELLPGLLAGVAWDTILDGALRRYIEREALVGFLQRQRWSGVRPGEIVAARFADWALVRAGTHPVFLTIVEAKLAEGADPGPTLRRYFLPLAAVSGDAAQRVASDAPSAVVARITGARKGLLVDAAWDDHACGLLLDAVSSGREMAAQEGTMRARRGTAYLPDEPAQLQPIERTGLAQRHTALRFGTRKMLRVFRRLDPGMSPDLEMVRHLERLAFDRLPPLAGWIEYAPVADGDASTLAIAQGLVRNQGDAWSWMLEELSRFFERATARGPAPPVPGGREWLKGREPLPGMASDLIGIPLVAAATIGRRTAEMHRLLARETDDPAFAPEPLDPQAVERLADEAAADAGATLGQLTADLISAVASQTVRDATLVAVHAGGEGTASSRGADHGEPGPAAPPNAAPTPAAVSAAIAARLAGVPGISDTGWRTRIHGDYHLGQILWAEQDLVVLDFGGEPARPVAERRAKRSPLRDVADMVRSFGYAARAALMTHARLRPDADATSAGGWSDLWERSVVLAFLGAYRDGMAGCPAVPQDDGAFAHLLDLFVVLKALSELRHELAARPEWVAIPLRALV